MIVEFTSTAGDAIEVTVEGECYGEGRDFECELTKVFITTDADKNDILYLLSNLDKNILESQLWDECHLAIEDEKMCAAEYKEDR